MELSALRKRWFSGCQPTANKNMQRIDTFLVEHQFVESRERAKRLILAGAVTVNGDSNIKPGQRVPADAKVVVQEQQKYVSRGGFKLEKALSTFGVDVQDRVALDVGASTGGFTDCLLQYGARFVYAVDVGYGQLAWKLRTHPQVLPVEKTNIRHLTPSHLKTASLRDTENFISIAVIDVSFISLRTVLPSVITLLTHQERGTETEYDIIALLKPQFEAGKAHVKKGGIVSDKQVHIQTIDNLSAFVTEKLGAVVMGITYSPIHKDIGNIEYLLWLTIDLDSQAHDPEDYLQSQQATAEIVAKAHDAFES
jgi:23S rRNA (cytidine1920-2'-O)/16S rRNA (cytidine1409-2'-O)-methyltransferase